jgi:hypothetical protein
MLSLMYTSSVTAHQRPPFIQDAAGEHILMIDFTGEINSSVGITAISG